MDDEPYDRDAGRPLDLGAWWHDLQIAAAFLTRLPIRQQEPAGLSALRRAARCFPLVGLGIGLVAGVAYAVAIEFALPPILAAVLAVAAAIVVTGALHEDGLADTADGFGGGADREAKLRIMRDSRIGTYGVIALILVLATQIAALSALSDSDDVAALLIVCHAASRALLVPVMHLESPARADGLAVSAGRPSPATTLWALGIAGAIALIFARFDGILASLIGAGVAWAVVWIARRQIGGITGDVLGSVQQATATAMLLTLVVLD